MWWDRAEMMIIMFMIMITIDGVSVDVLTVPKMMVVIGGVSWMFYNSKGVRSAGQCTGTVTIFTSQLHFSFFPFFLFFTFFLRIAAVDHGFVISAEFCYPC